MFAERGEHGQNKRLIETKLNYYYYYYDCPALATMLHNILQIVNETLTTYKLYYPLIRLKYICSANGK